MMDTSGAATPSAAAAGNMNTGRTSVGPLASVNSVSGGGRPKIVCNYDLISQHISLFDIDLVDRSLAGVTVIKFRPCNLNLDVSYMPFIDINCSQQVSVARVKVNGVTAAFTSADFQQSYRYSILNIKSYVKTMPDKAQKPQFIPCSLRALNPYIDEVLSKDSYRGRGELRINVPGEVQAGIRKHGRKYTMDVHIEFQIRKPKSGFYFYKSPNLPERENHMYNYSKGTPGYARLCFPCIDTWTALCTWKFEMTVPINQYAIASGMLTRLDEDKAKGTSRFIYELTVPTIAANIGLVAGNFQTFCDNPNASTGVAATGNEPAITHLCPYPLLPLLKDTVKFTPRDSITFYEDLLGARLPYKQYTQIFVYDSFEKAMPFAGLTIFDARILHSSIIVDQVPKTRMLMAHALAKQFFSKYINPECDRDFWVPTGLAGYIFSQWLKKQLGNSEYRHWLKIMMQKLTTFETDVGPVRLSPMKLKKPNPQNPVATAWAPQNDHWYFPIRYTQSQSHDYHKMILKKSILVMRFFEHRIGVGLLNQAVSKMLVLAEKTCQQSLENLVKKDFKPLEKKYPTAVQSNYYRGELGETLFINTSQFMKACSNVCARQIDDIVTRWVDVGGVVEISATYGFDKNRNTIDLTIVQNTESPGTQSYRGPLSIRVQELDGSFPHSVQIEDKQGEAFKTSLGCHSRSRAKKNKKIPLMNKTEVQMNIKSIDEQSPILWVRLDPDMLLLRRIKIAQKEFMWHLMLNHERDICGQLVAVQNLQHFPSGRTWQVLQDTVANEEQFWRVRYEAALMIAQVHNKQALRTDAPMNPQDVLNYEKYITEYKRRYYLEHENVFKKNRFQRNIPNYFVQQAETMALGLMRVKSVNSQVAGKGVCPIDCITVLLEVLKYNENKQCSFSDVYWVASILKALQYALTECMTSPTQHLILPPDADKLAALPVVVKEILSTTLRLFNMDRIMPQYKYKISQTCLYILRLLQRLDYLPDDSSIFVHYAKSPHFPELRVIAISALVDFIQRNQSAVEEFHYILEIGLCDPSPYIRHKTLKSMRKNPPWAKPNIGSPLDTFEINQKLWMKIYESGDIDYRVRTDVIDLYHTLYGPGQPEVVKTQLRKLNAENPDKPPLAIEGDEDIEIGIKSFHTMNPQIPAKNPTPDASTMPADLAAIAAEKKRRESSEPSTKSKKRNKVKKDKKKKKKRHKERDQAIDGGPSRPQLPMGVPGAILQHPCGVPSLTPQMINPMVKPTLLSQPSLISSQASTVSLAGGNATEPTMSGSSSDDDDPSQMMM